MRFHWITWATILFFSIGLAVFEIGWYERIGVFFLAVASGIAGAAIGRRLKRP